MISTQEIPFDFFKEVAKSHKHIGSGVSDADDEYVSYCVQCQTPMTVQSLVTHSKTNSKHEVKSLNEMKRHLEGNLSSKVELLKKSLQRIEAYKVEEQNESHLHELKDQGLRKLAGTRDQLIDAMNTYFNRVEKNWIALFEENFFMAQQKEKVSRELNILAKIHLKAKQAFNGESNKGVSKFADLKEGLNVDGMIPDSKYITRKCNTFIKKLEHMAHIKTYPELEVNKFMMNNLHFSLKHLFDYNFDFSIEKLSSCRQFKLKIPDFFKPKAEHGKPTYHSKQVATTDHLNKYLPVLAKNRRLMVYDLPTSHFKELLLSEIHSIPQGNQILLSPLNLYKYYIVGGHFFKKASNKLFELNSANSEFKPLANLNKSRWMHRALCFKEYIYVTGGTDNEKEIPIDSVELYSVIDNVWEELPKLNHARHSHTMVCYHPSDKLTKIDKRQPTIYVFGGIGLDRRYQNKIERFDIERNSWSVIDFDNSFEFSSINGFGHQINDNEILLFGGSKYLEDMTGVVKDGRAEFINYPFNNPYVYIFNVDEEHISCNDSYALPYGVNFAGVQPIFHNKKLFFMGNLNSKSNYQNVHIAEFTEETQAQKLIGAVSRENIEVLDYVLFN